MPRSSMLERGIQVLQAFGPEGRTLTLPALTDRTGLPKATVYRLAEELVGLGMLERRPPGYCLGLGLVALGDLAQSRSGLRETALPFMQELCALTQATVHLGARSGADVVYVEKIMGRHGADAPSRVGQRLPLSCTGVGKALLAFGAPEVRDEVLGRPLRRLTAHSVTDPARLAAQLADIGRTRLAVDREEAAPGVACLAAPVVVDGQAVAAVSVTVPLRRVNVVAYASAVRSTGAALGHALRASQASVQLVGRRSPAGL